MSFLFTDHRKNKENHEKFSLSLSLSWYNPTIFYSTKISRLNFRGKQISLRNAFSPLFFSFFSPRPQFSLKFKLYFLLTMRSSSSRRNDLSLTVSEFPFTVTRRTFPLERSFYRNAQEVSQRFTILLIPIESRLLPFPPTVSIINSSDSSRQTEPSPPPLPRNTRTAVSRFYPAPSRIPGAAIKFFSGASRHEIVSTGIHRRTRKSSCPPPGTARSLINPCASVCESGKVNVGVNSTRAVYLRATASRVSLLAGFE